MCGLSVEVLGSVCLINVAVAGSAFVISNEVTSSVCFIDIAVPGTTFVISSKLAGSVTVDSNYMFEELVNHGSSL